MSYSVLMSVYHKENALWFKESIDSILNQTIPTDDFVIICDGPLTPDLDAVLENIKHSHQEILHVVRLEKNQGLGNALRIGIKECKNEIILRMDSDDYSYPTRAEVELELLNSGCDLVGSAISEFEGDHKLGVTGYKTVPQEHEKIVKFSKKRNPFNHPTVAFRKSVVERAGGYLDFPLTEDYYLWIRMIQSGARCANSGQVLLAMRAGASMRNRRTGRFLLKWQYRLRKYMLKTKYVNIFQFCSSVTKQTIFILMPASFKRLAYKVFLRKNKKTFNP